MKVLLAVLLFATALPAQTRQDSLDYVKARRTIDTLRVSNGFGARRRLADSSQAALDRLWRAWPEPPPPAPVNQPPVASFEVSCAQTTRLCAVNAGASTDDDKVVSYAWRWGDGAVSSSNTVTANHQYAAAGNFIIQLTVADSAGLTAITSRAALISPTDPEKPPTPPVDTVTVAELPRANVDITYPVRTGRTLRVTGVSIQSALDSARCGDDVVVPNIGNYTGNLTLRQNCGTNWIVLRAETLPPAGQLTEAAAAALPAITTTVSSTATRCPIRAEDGASGYRVVGLAVKVAPTLKETRVLICFGDSDELTVAAVPKNLIADRVYLFAHDSADVRFGVYGNCGNCALINSRVVVHSNFDAAGWMSVNGTGPMLIQNNYISATGQGVMVGGGSLLIANVQPSDMTIRGNYFEKRVGKWPNQKNAMELKTGLRVLIEQNIFQGIGTGTQPCDGFVATATDSDAGAPWATVSDITFRWNELRGMRCAFNFMGYTNATKAFINNRMSINNNLIQSLAPGNRVAVIYQHQTHNAQFFNNTFLGSDYNLQITSTVPDTSIRGFVWKDNLSSTWTSVHTVAGLGEAAINKYALRPVVTGNVYVTPGVALPGTPGVPMVEFLQKISIVTAPPAARTIAPRTARPTRPLPQP